MQINQCSRFIVHCRSKQRPIGFSFICNARYAKWTTIFMHAFCCITFNWRSEPPPLPATATKVQINFILIYSHLLCRIHCNQNIITYVYFVRPFVLDNWIETDLVPTAGGAVQFHSIDEMFCYTVVQVFNSIRLQVLWVRYYFSLLSCDAAKVCKWWIFPGVKLLNCKQKKTQINSKNAYKNVSPQK